MPCPHRIVAEHDSLVPNRDLGEFLHPLELVCDLRNDAIVVSEDEMNTAATNSLAIGERHLRPAHAEVAQEVQLIFSLHALVEPGEDHVVHFRSAIEWTVAVSNDVGMTEVEIGREPRSLHSLTIMVPVPPHPRSGPTTRFASGDQAECVCVCASAP